MEALILFFVLFFPGVYALGFPGEGGGQIPFSLIRELGRTLTYTIPSLALLGYIIFDKKDFSSLKPEKLKSNDLLSFAAGFPGLIIIGLGITLLVSLFPNIKGFAPPPKAGAPVNVAGWIVIIFSCLGTGYLEECYFRYYLLTRMENSLPRISMRIIFSTFLFSICHIYGGPWAVINAILAGALLSVLFIRYRSLHGIAWAHGAYNIIVYVLGALNR